MPLPKPVVPELDLAEIRARTRLYEAYRDRSELLRAGPMYTADADAIGRAASAVGPGPAGLGRLSFPSHPEGSSVKALEGARDEVRRFRAAIASDVQTAERYLQAAPKAVAGESAGPTQQRAASVRRELEDRSREAQRLCEMVESGLELRAGGFWDRLRLYVRQLLGRDPATLLSALRERLARWGAAGPAVLGAELTYVHGALKSVPFPEVFTPLPYADTTGEIALEDRTQGREIELSPDVVAKASELGSAKAAFDFVRASVRPAWYYGSLQGATQTLRTLRANDVDAAALLVALLRAQGTPARYVRGKVDLPLEKLVDLMGVADGGAPDAAASQRVLAVLGASGIPFEAVTAAGRVKSVRLLHTWVEAFLPYASYRGAEAGPGPREWVPMEPLLPGGQKHRVHPGEVDAWGEGGFSAEQLVDRYLGDGTGTSPLDLAREEATRFLAAQHPGVPYASALRRVENLPETLPLVPGSLPYEVVSVTDRFAFVPDAMKHMFRVVVSDASGALLDVTVPAHQVVGHRTSLLYMPATEADQELVAAAGDLYSAPAALVQVVPELRIEGRPVVGTRPLGLGQEHDWRIELLLPDGTRRAIDNRIIAGNVVAIGLGAPGNGYVEPPAADGADHDGPSPRFLYARAAKYANDWTSSEEELAALLRVVAVRPTASLVLVENQLAVDQALGIPRRVTWKGLEVDADHRAITPIELVAGRGTELLRISGYQGSFLEAQVLEEGTRTQAISAVGVLKHARARGVPVATLTPENVATMMGTIAAPAQVLQDVMDQVTRGREVTIPTAPLAIQNWTGTGYVARDRATEEGGYFLSGRVSGGQTIVSPEYWSDPELVASLESPTLRPTTNDLTKAYRIVKVETGEQEVTVGQAFPKRLTVTVVTREGFPVVGAKVTFVNRAMFGGGQRTSGAQFAEPVSGARYEAVTIVTDPRGRASVEAFPDTVIGHWSVMRRTGPSEQLVGLNVMSAEVNTGEGTITLAEPFVGIGLPDVPSQVKLLAETAWAAPEEMILGQDLPATVLDRFGNPIANEPVRWTQSPATGAFIEPAFRATDKIVVLDPRDPAQMVIPPPRLTDTLGAVVMNFIPGAWQDDLVHVLTASVLDSTGRPVRASYTVRPILVSRYVFGYVPNLRASFDGIYADWPGSPDKVSSPEPYVFQMLRRGDPGERAWIPVTGSETSYSDVSVQMSTAGAGGVLAQETQRPWEILFDPLLDTEDNLVFWPKYLVADGTETLTFVPQVMLADGTRDCCSSDTVFSFSHRSTSVTVGRLRAAPGEQWLPLEGESAMAGDLAVAFTVSNSGSFPLWARVVQTPSAAGQQLVNVPGPDVFPRHPTDPTLLRIPPFRNQAIGLGLVAGSGGGTVRVDVYSPDAVRGPDVLTALAVASATITVPAISPELRLHVVKPVSGGSFVVTGVADEDRMTAEVVGRTNELPSWTISHGAQPWIGAIEPQTLGAQLGPRYATTAVPRTGRGQEFSFIPGMPPHPAYRAGNEDCASLKRCCSTCAAPWWAAKGGTSDVHCGNGCRSEKSPALTYAISASRGPHTTSQTAAQDEVDAIIQEYYNHGLHRGLIGEPVRLDFKPFQADGRRVRGIQPTAYRYQMGDAAQLADAVWDMFDAIAADTTVSGPTPGPYQPVVRGPVDVIWPDSDKTRPPGRGPQTFVNLSPVTPPNRGCTPRTGHGPRDPDPDCDDELSADGAFIHAGRNGRAETVPVDVAFLTSLTVTSGWRNPERNEAVGGAKQSAHQMRDSIDLVYGARSTTAPRRGDAELRCLLVTAGYRVVNECMPFGPCAEKCQPYPGGNLTRACRWLSQAERSAATPTPCNGDVFDHVHINR